MPRKRKDAFAFETFDDGGTDVILILSGRVDTQASAVLGPTCARILDARRQAILDLLSVKSADGVGLRLLLSLSQVGVTLANVPSSIAQKIELVERLLA